MSRRALDDPELEERRLLALRHIRQLGDPVLRTPAAEIVVFDAELKREASEMVSLMRDARGVGLAAPQIGRLRRMIVIEPGEDLEPLVLVNPRIEWRSDEEEVGVEGCLSIGEVVVDVSRATTIRVTAQDTGGAPVELECEGYEARVVQHEVDHLDGILMLDRTDPEQRREALRQLRTGELPGTENE